MWDPIPKIIRAKKRWRMVQAVYHLLSKHETLEFKPKYCQK
jgi:hypothetical protein